MKEVTTNQIPYKSRTYDAVTKVTAVTEVPCSPVSPGK